MLEQFHRHLKKGDIFAALGPGEPTSPAAPPLGSPAFGSFVRSNGSNVLNRTRIECEFNQSGHDGGHGSTGP